MRLTLDCLHRETDWPMERREGGQTDREFLRPLVCQAKRQTSKLKEKLSLGSEYSSNRVELPEDSSQYSSGMHLNCR